MGVSILGVNIKRIRESKGISAYRLAKDAKVGNSTISEIESGIRQSLNSHTVEKIADALSTTADELFAIPMDEEFVVTDINDVTDVILSSDELTLDNTELSKSEKAQIQMALQMALDIIRRQRNQ